MEASSSRSNSRAWRSGRLGANSSTQCTVNEWARRSGPMGGGGERQAGREGARVRVRVVCVCVV